MRVIDRKRQGSSGFTLVEVMIVVGILALLAAIAIPNLLRAKISSNESSAQVTLKSISTALENYSILNNVYPADTSNLIGATPPYLNVDYFTGTHNGYNFTSSTLTDYSYLITAAPVSANTGSHSYTIATGGVLQQY